MCLKPTLPFVCHPQKMLIHHEMCSDEGKDLEPDSHDGMMMMMMEEEDEMHPYCSRDFVVEMPMFLMDQ